MSTRRKFIARAAVGIAGSLAARSLHAAEAQSGQPRKIKDVGVQLAIASICCDGFGNENFEPTFRLAPQAGFKNIEFNCWYNRNLTPEGIRSIKSRCEQKGLRPISVQGASFGDGRTPDLAHKLWCMEMALQLGCQRVKFTGSRRGQNGGLETIIGTLKELAPAAEEMGILICVENHANNNLENIADYDAIFSAIDSPNVGLCLDTGHFDGAAVPIPEVVERFHSRTVHVDLKDCKSFGAYKTVRFGEGITDLDGTIQSLLSRGYQGYLVVEQAPPIDPNTLEADLADAYQRFQNYESKPAS